MNSVIMSGRLTADPQVRVTNGDKPITIANFTLAVDRIGKDAGADFINCTAFDKTAELMEKYVKKGNKIIAEGRIATGSYTDKDGKKVYTTSVTVSRVEFCFGKNENEAAHPEIATADGFMTLPLGVEDEGLPFN